MFPGAHSIHVTFYILRKTAEEYVKGRQSRVSSESGSGRGGSRVSFAESSKPRQRERVRVPSSTAWTCDPDGDDVSLSQFGVRCDTLTPTSSTTLKNTKKQKSSKKSKNSEEEPMNKKDKLNSVMSSYLK
jgi:hypothetical protein